MRLEKYIIYCTERWRAELVKLLRTIQLDASDSFVFEKPAAAGEWAVSGGFAFVRSDPANLQGKARTAFRAGFLGLSSLGRSTLAQIVEASEADRLSVVEMLAGQLVSRFGDPIFQRLAWQPKKRSPLWHRSAITRRGYSLP
jgi:hypothetical protein